MDKETSLVAGTYRVLSEIGSGGGGIVYLAEHIRLGKQVVMKADKRTLSAKPEALRREVDALKNLSHTNIPQVYDFIEEDGTIYTVMDFIEGDSFDKPLKRGERFSQAQVIEWACQLLDALAYLHSRPPHGILHADIKPANVMLTPQGDVRLIDFNIALALGEEGAVAVGRSFGYASPEHYGLDYSTSSPTISPTHGMTTEVVTDSGTVLTGGVTPPPGTASPSETVLTGAITPPSGTASPSETVLEAKPAPSSSGSSSSKKTIMLDVRSDIYGLGATLYHIMTGERPAQNAPEVKPISPNDFSPAVIAIISKAMNPDQNLRWQTAEEMLYAFKHLHENDPRTKRHRRSTIITTAILAALFLAGGGTIFAGQRLMEQEQQRIAAEAIEREKEQAKIAEEQTLLAQLNEAYALAEYSSNALREGDVDEAISYALQALSNAPIAEAQKALTDALGVYDLSDGYKPHKLVALPGEVIKLAVSPSGELAAVLTLGVLSIVDANEGVVLESLPTVESALADAVFIDDETIVYAGADGITMYSLATKQTLWTGEQATTISVSFDGSRIAAVYRDDNFATVYGVDGRKIDSVSFGDKHLWVPVNDRFHDPKDSIFALNADGSKLAVSFADGFLCLYDFIDSDEDIGLHVDSDYTHLEGGFYEKYFVFSASDDDDSLLAAIDTVEFIQTYDAKIPGRVGVEADENGVFLTYRNRRVKYDPATHEETDPEFGRIQLPYSYEYNNDKQEIVITCLVSNVDKEIFRYDSFYDHFEARISADRKTIMLYGTGGFQLYKVDGEPICEVLFDEGIYDPRFSRTDGQSYLEVVYYDGLVRKYSAEDGSMLSEEKGTPPDESLFEEFFTDAFRITSTLNGTPIAYDVRSGEQIRELEKDAYLTYVTQCGAYIITEYISTIDWSRYGLLLDGKTLETLAVLPNLCDVLDDMLIFDIHPGSLREQRIFSLDELLAGIT